MKTYLVLVFVAVLFFWNSYQKVGNVTVILGIKPRGVRNNNPLNIRESSSDTTAWEGERTTDDDPQFEEFTTVPYGYRAAARTVRTYRNKYGLNTIRGIVTRWAPNNENETENYISFVSTELGMNPDSIIDVYNAEMCAKLIFTMSVMENGRGWFTLDQARQGVALA